MKHTSLRTPLALAVGLTLSAGYVQAETARELGTLVVTASGFEQNMTQAPASISVLTREDLQQQRFSNLAEALQTMEGIDVRGATGKTGGLNISIRGMPSDYTLILIDGQRQNTSGDVGPNGFGEFSTSFMPPLSAIERIEVIRGPASTLYGSDAMGGVVNIITRNVSDEWGTTLTLDTSFQEDQEFGNSSGANFFTTGPLIENLLGLQLRGAIQDREASRLQPTGDADEDVSFNTRGQTPVKARLANLGGRLTLTPHQDHSFYLDLDRSTQWYDNGDPDNRLLSNNDSPTNWRGYDDQLEFFRNQLLIGHRSELGFGRLESSVMYQVTESEGRTIPGNPQDPDNSGIPGKRVGDPRELENTNLIINTKLVAPVANHRITLGGQYWDAEFVDGIAPDKMQQTTSAVFVEDEWFLHEKAILTLGGRYDHHDTFGGHFSPRAYLVSPLTDQLTIKGGVGQGFKAPRVDQIQQGLTGITAQGEQATIGSPHLEPEISTSYELGVHWEDLSGFRASATVFYNEIEDKIASGPGVANCDYAANPDQPGCVSVGGFTDQAEFGQSINVDEATTQGLELSTYLPLDALLPQARGWVVSANYTYTDSTLKNRSEGQKDTQLSDTPEHSLNARISWAVNDQLTTWLSAEYRGESRRFDQHPDDLTGNDRLIYEQVGDIKAYELFHLGAAYQVAANVTLRGTVYNLLDKDFRSWKAYTNEDGETDYASEYSHQTRSTRGGVQEGRLYWLSATFDF